jgi:hypothetical protein
VQETNASFSASLAARGGAFNFGTVPKMNGRRVHFRKPFLFEHSQDGFASSPVAGLWWA